MYAIVDIETTGGHAASGAITEILLYRDKGLKFVGPLPADIQNYTAYSATVMIGTAQAAAARAFVAYLGSARGQAIFKAAGINPGSVHVYLINDNRINAFVAGGQRIFIVPSLDLVVMTTSGLYTSPRQSHANDLASGYHHQP